MISPNTTKPTSVASFIFGMAFWLLLTGSARADEYSPAIPAVLLSDAPTQAANASPTEHISPYRARFGRSRPVIAVLAENRGTETVDFVVPYGILTRAAVAEVVAVATQSGPIQLFPALKIEAQATTAGFDARFPDGADYVIVPAVQYSDDPVLLAWISGQAAKGATVVSICDGAFVVGNTGLLKGRRATGHWFSQKRREKKYPETIWLKNTRYVADGTIVSTSGVTAAIPLSIALVEAIAGHTRAAALAAELGVIDWNAAHDSEPFHLTARHLSVFVGNKLAFWRHEKVGVPVEDGTDEITVALVADAYSRTARSTAYIVSKTGGPIRTHGGLNIIPDRQAGAPNAPKRILPPLSGNTPVIEFDRALSAICISYGRPTASMVALQLEYPQP